LLNIQKSRVCVSLYEMIPQTIHVLLSLQHMFRCYYNTCFVVITTYVLLLLQHMFCCYYNTGFVVITTHVSSGTVLPGLLKYTIAIGSLQILISTSRFQGVRFEVVTVVKMMMFFWVITPYELVVRYQRFGETHCLHLQPLRLRQYVSPKRWYLPMSLHGVTTKNISMLQLILGSGFGYFL
jgi:hypothetical protein